MHTIDAKDNTLGRIASEAAVLLMGKDNPDFQKHLVADVKVQIINASQMKIDPKKRKQKEYVHYTGHPGGLRTQNMDKILTDKGYEEILRKAVYGMLPSNRLRKVLMKNLIVTE